MVDPEKRKKRMKKEKRQDAVADETDFEVVPAEDGEDKKKKKKKKAKAGGEDGGGAAAAAGGGGGGRKRATLSIAVPGSIITNAQKPELKVMLAGQIARAAAVFRVDEVVVFDDRVGPGGKMSEGATFLARILQYLETPQYLRKSLIPMHSDLRLAGLLPPLDAPHQPRMHEWSRYREGVVVPDPEGKAGAGRCLVDVGLPSQVAIAPELPPGIRVTTELGENRPSGPPQIWGVLQGKAVAPSAPSDNLGVYWGYTTRICSHVSGVFSGCPYPGGYDFALGTSEHGEVPVGERLRNQIPEGCGHVLVAFGGLQGLEDSVQVDASVDADAPASLFHHYINTCPKQGSRTIRTEEAVLVSLAFLTPILGPVCGYL